MGARSFHPPADRTLLFIGDTHIGDNPVNRWTKFADAFLADSFKPAGIVHIGDLTDQSDAPSVTLAKQWWARFPDPKTMMNGDHDLLNGVTLAQWQSDYGVAEFKTVDFGFVAVITTHYAMTATRRDEIIAAAAAVAPKPVYLCIHRPLRDTTGAGVAPHDNLSASAPLYQFAESASEDPLTRAAVDASSNIVAVFSGHSHAWLDDPGAAITQSMGARTVPVINTSAITYVGSNKQFFSDPLVGLLVTLLADNKSVQIRYRDYGAGGVYTFWDRTRGKVTTLTAVTPPAAPSVRSSATGTVAAGTDVVISQPAGLAAGDLMLAAIADRGAATDTITPPSGWTVVVDQARGSVGRMIVYSKVATGSEPASYTFTCSSTNTQAGAIVALRNATAVDASAGATATVATGLHTCPTVTAAGGNELAVRIVATAVGALPLSWTWPGGVTEVLDFNSTGTGAGGIAIATEPISAAGAIGTRDATFAQSSSTTYAAATVAVR